MEQKLLSKSAELLREQGLEQAASIRDDHGINAMIFTREDLDDAYMIAAKKYAYQGLASFQYRQVKHAEASEFVLVFYEDQHGTFTAFDPQVVLENGNLSEGKSKHSNIKWLELPLTHGVAFERHVNGASLTEQVPENQSQLTAF